MKIQGTQKCINMIIFHNYNKLFFYFWKMLLSFSPPTKGKQSTNIIPPLKSLPQTFHLVHPRAICCHLPCLYIDTAASIIISYANHRSLIIEHSLVPKKVRNPKPLSPFRVLLLRYVCFRLLFFICFLGCELRCAFSEIDARN